MTGEDDTRQPCGLPLMDGAELGLPVEEPELIPQQIAELEFPKDSRATARPWWRKRMEQAIKDGDLAAREVLTVTRTLGGVRMVRTYLDGALVHDSQKVKRVPSSTPNNRHERKTWCVSRDAYRTWRATQPAFAGSLVHLWLGTAPASSAPTLPQGEPDKPEPGAAAKRETELQMHRRECQEIGKRLWAENPNSTKAAIMKHRDMLFYVQTYKGKNTVPGWLAEIDPRPEDKRRGRPKKIPV